MTTSTDLATAQTNNGYVIDWLNTASADVTANPTKVADDLSCALSYAKIAQTALNALAADLAAPTGPTGPATGPTGVTGTTGATGAPSGPTGPATGATGPATGPTGTTPPPSKLIRGFYTGSNTVAAIQNLGKTLSAKLVNGFSFYTDGSTWSSIGSWRPPTVPAGEWLLLGVDLTPNNTGLSAITGSQKTQALAAFTQLAKTLIGVNTVIRLGWEFDGSWMPWGTGANGNTAAMFNPAVSLVIPAMKAVNPALKFDFSCNTGTSNLSQLQVYYGSNGDSLWDYIGGDHYDNKGGGGDFSQMQYVVQLAVQRGKPVSIGEWGLNGADNPAFINSGAQFILNPSATIARYTQWKVTTPYTVGPTSYFSVDLQINSDITQFKNSEAAYAASGL